PAARRGRPRRPGPLGGRSPVTGLLLALCAATGTYLLYTAVVFGWRGLAPGPRLAGAAARRTTLADRLVAAGLAAGELRQFAAVAAALPVAGGAAGLARFGGPVPALAPALPLGGAPGAAVRARRGQRRAAPPERWA